MLFRLASSCDRYFIEPHLYTCILKLGEIILVLKMEVLAANTHNLQAQVFPELLNSIASFFFH